MKKILKIIVIILFIIGIIYYTLPFFVTVNLKTIPESYNIYDTNKIKIWEIIKDNKYRHIESKLDEIPKFLLEALVLMEDKTFYKNSGIDYSAIVRATISNFNEWKVVEWASTISSQLIRNSYGLNEKRTLKRKANEFLLALALNKKYTKDEILGKYCNILYFGYMNYGFASASEFYFGKTLENLTKAEIIALLVIPKNSNIFNPLKNKKIFDERFEYLVEYFYKNKLLSEKEYIYVKNEKIDFDITNDNKLNYIEDFIKLKYFGNKDKLNPPQVWEGTLGDKIGYSDIREKNIVEKDIITNIDYNLTLEVKKLADTSILDLENNNVSDYGIIILEKNTNKLKVMIWWRDYNNKEHGQVNSTISLRQVGSTIKPFTYLLAFHDLGLTVNDKILDLPIQYKTNEWYSYAPQNYSLDFKWEVTLATALSQSLNIPAIKLTERIWTQRLHQLLQSLGISSLTKNSEEYGLALTLWTGEITLYELVRAFTLFAHNGEVCDINIIENEDRYCKEIIESKYTDMVETILTNRYFKINSFPINSNLDFPDRYVFVKTGTSRNFRDNFAVGFTRNYIIWIWVGNKDASYMEWVTGVSGAGHIFKKIVYKLEKEKEDSKIVVLEEKKLDFIKITHPLNNSKFLIEDFRPENSQKIKLEFTTNLKYDHRTWSINWIETNEKFIFLEEGVYNVELELYLEWKKIWKTSSHIEISR